MSSELTLVPAVISAMCSNGAVRVQYSVELVNDAFGGTVGTGEVDLVDDDIAAKVEELTDLVRQKLAESIGEVAESGNPLGDEPSAASYDDEETL